MTPRPSRNVLRRLQSERRWLLRAAVALVVVDAALGMTMVGGLSFLSW